MENDILSLSRIESSTFAHYQIIKILGEGGMGKVYAAKDSKLNREVALKIIKETEYTSQGKERFLMEAQAMAKLNHPNIVPIYEIGEFKGLYYYTMQFIKGKTLAQIIKERSLPWKEMVKIVHKIALAADYAHKQGIIHRDLKPSNIMLNEEKCPYILDFGLAKILQSPSSISVSGMIIGTLAYMSPEQADGKSALIDHKTDIYALGAILYECITGRPPFQGSETVNVLFQIMHHEPIHPKRLVLGIHDDLETICLKCLEKQKNRRYSTARDLADDLQSYLEGKPVKARPASLGYRLWCLMMRNKIALFIISVMLILLLSSIGMLIRGFLKYKWQKEIAEKQTAIAIRENEESNRQKNIAMANLVDAYLHLGKYQENISNYAHASLCYAKAFTLSSEVESSSKDIFGERASIQARDALQNLCASYQEIIRIAPWQRDYSISELAMPLSGDSLAFSDISKKASLFNLFTGDLEKAMDRVSAIAFHPDGKTIAVATLDNTLWTWHQGKIVHTLSAQSKHSKTIYRLIFTQNGDSLVSVSDDQVVSWNPEQSNEKHIWDVGFSSLDFVENQDGLWMALHKNGTLELWNMQKNLLHASIQLFNEKDEKKEYGIIERICLSFEADIVAIVYGKQIQVWNIKTAKPLPFSLNLQNTPSDVSFEHHGKRLLVASNSDSILLWNPISDDRRTLVPGIAKISTFTPHPSGKLLAIPDIPNAKIWLWDMAKNSMYQQLKMPEGKLDRIVCQGNGEMVAVIMEQNTLCVYKPGQKAKIWPIPFPANAIVRSKNEKLLAVVMYDTISIFDVEKEAAIVQISGEEMVCQANFHPIKEEILLANISGNILHYEIRTGKLLQKLDGHAGNVSLLYIHRDGKKMLSSGEDNALKMCNLETGKSQTIKNDLLYHKIHPDGRFIAVQNVGEPSLTLFDLDTENSVIPEQKEKWEKMAYQTVYFASEIMALSNKDGNFLDIWKLSPLTYLNRLEIRKGTGIQKIAISETGKFLACITEDGEIHIWNMETQTLCNIYEGTSGVTKDLMFFSDNLFARTIADQPYIYLHDGMSGQIISVLYKGQGEGKIYFSPDGFYLIYKADTDSVNIWDMNGVPQKILSRHHKGVAFMTFAARAPLLASGSYDGTLRIWDVEKCQEILLCPDYSTKNKEFCFSPDGNWLAFIDANNALILCNQREKGLMHTGKLSIYSAISFSPDSRFLAIAEKDNISLLELDTLAWTRLPIADGIKADNIYKLAFSTNGNWLAAIVEQEYVVVWDMEQKKAFKRWKTNHRVAEVIEFSPCGQYLVTAGQDGTVKLWSVDSFSQSSDMSTPISLGKARDTIDHLSLSEEGYLASGSRDGRITVWKLPNIKIGEINGYAWEGQSLALISGKGWLAFKDKNQITQLYDLLKFRKITELQIPGEKADSLCGTIHGDYLAIGGTKQKIILQKTGSIYDLLKLKSSEIEHKIESETGFHLDRFRPVPIPPQWK